MIKPDSLLAAAKTLAEVTRLEWSTVQKYYRALQGTPNKDEGWLPRSLGRNVWMAHPNYISRILVTLAAASDPHDAIPTTIWSQTLTPSGRNFEIAEGLSAGISNPFEAQMSSFLWDPAKAINLDHVEFQRDKDYVIFRLKNGDELTFSPNSQANLENPNEALMIQNRGVISGMVFQELSRKVNWTRDDLPPYTSNLLDDGVVI